MNANIVKHVALHNFTRPRALPHVANHRLLVSLPVVGTGWRKTGVRQKCIARQWVTFNRLWALAEPALDWTFGVAPLAG